MANVSRAFLLDGSGATASDCTPATTENLILQEVARESTTDVTVALSGTDVGFPKLFAWTSGPIGNDDWPNGTYTHSFRVTSIPTGTFAGRARIIQVNSGCTLVSQLADTAGFNATGTYTWSPTLNPGAASVTDRYQIVIEAAYVGASGNLTIDVDHADSFVTVPLANFPIGAIAGEAARSARWWENHLVPYDLEALDTHG